MQKDPGPPYTRVEPTYPPVETLAPRTAPAPNVRRSDAGHAPEDIARTLNSQRVRPLTTALVRVLDAKTVRRLLWTNFRIRVEPPGQVGTATILALSTQGLGQTAIAQELARRGIHN